MDPSDCAFCHDLEHINKGLVILLVGLTVFSVWDYLRARTSSL